MASFIAYGIGSCRAKVHPAFYIDITVYQGKAGGNRPMLFELIIKSCRKSSEIFLIAVQTFMSALMHMLDKGDDPNATGILSRTRFYPLLKKTCRKSLTDALSDVLLCKRDAIYIGRLHLVKGILPLRLRLQFKNSKDIGQARGIWICCQQGVKGISNTCSITGRSEWVYWIHRIEEQEHMIYIVTQREIKTR